VTSAELLLHPVRLRILQAFLGDRALTTAQLQAELPNVPPASLYRHVARLAAAGVLTVIDERRVRGALERTYTLQSSEATVKADDLADLSADDHRRMFFTFLAEIIRDFELYLERGDIDLIRDGVSYRLSGMWLTDTEARTLARQFNEILLPATTNLPKRGRKRRYFGSILLPAPEPSARAREPDGTTAIR
jgi:predicted DNA-binding transcriptional regulator YafY